MCIVFHLFAVNSFISISFCYLSSFNAIRWNLGNCVYVFSDQGTFFSRIRYRTHGFKLFNCSSRYLIRLQRVSLKRKGFEENLFHPISFMYLFTNFPIPWYSSNRVTFTLLVSMGRRCSVSNHFWNGLSLVDKTASDLLSPNERNPPYIHTCDGLVQVGHLHHGLVG